MFIELTTVRGNVRGKALYNLSDINSLRLHKEGTEVRLRSGAEFIVQEDYECLVVRLTANHAEAKLYS